MVWITGALGVVLNLITPFTEEPWIEPQLAEKFGAPYLTEALYPQLQTPRAEVYRATQRLSDLLLAGG